MNILFYYRYCRVGGVQTVTHFLANAFQALGHQCVVLYLEGDPTRAKEQLDPRIPLVIANTTNRSKSRQCLIDALRAYQPNVIINQGGHDFDSTKLLVQVLKNRKLPLISVYHNMPGFALNLRKKEPGVIGWISELKHRIDVLRAGWGMRYIYGKSNYFCLLSESFIPLFKAYTRLSHFQKLRVIPNPITVPLPQETELQRKEKEIIYVGRLSPVKRVDRILRIWSNIENDFLDWRLTIIGDGEERGSLEALMKTLHLKRVHFDGMQDPSEYYKRASILLLTSDFEGFGLVILEAMTHQVLPIVYASYPAVYDIISHQQDGIIVEAQKNESLLIEEFAGILRRLMGDPNYLDILRRQAHKKSSKYSIQSIADTWVQLFTSAAN